MGLAVDQLSLGPIGTNCYLVRRDAAAGEAVVIDPGAEADAILVQARENAESLVEREGFDATDQMRRYLRWWRDGHNSSTDFWVGFKLWGAIPLTFIFALANIPMLMRHGLNREEAKPEEPGPIE